MRELEPCLRSLLRRGAYLPARPAEASFAERVRDGTLTAERLLDGYCAQISIAAGGNWREAGRRLGMDWRTVRTRATRAT